LITSSVQHEDFTGVYGFLALNSLMTKRALWGVVALLAVSFSALGQQVTGAGAFDPVFAFYRPDFFTTVDSAALVRQLPMTEFLDGRLPGSTPLGRMGTAPVANFPMALVSAEPRQKGKAGSASVTDPKDGKDYSSTEAMAVEKASLAWTGGEIGFMYGHSSGKFGGDEFSSYITGGVGNEHMQINVGASYEEFNGRIPRWRP
jgi:hypothetical protein